MAIICFTPEIKPTGKHEGWQDLYEGRFIQSTCTGQEAMVVDIETGEDFMVEMTGQRMGYALALTYECSCGQANCVHASVMHSSYMRDCRAEDAWMRKHER